MLWCFSGDGVTCRKVSVASCTSSAVSLCPVKKGEKSRIDIKYCEEEEEEEEFLPRAFFPHHRPFASHATKKKEIKKVKKGRGATEHGSNSQ